MLSGRFTGGGFQIEPDPIGKLTYGFTIHCDLLLSNNLELNWNGNQFHMLEHLTTATCDTIGLAPNPPVAGVNRIIGVGTGRYNGTDGYTINFTLIDHSEPGVNDEVAFVITGPGGVVINVPLSAVEGGNVQAHEDQPHKNVL